MVMSVKPALLVCLLFIFGMTWAVNQAALPGSGGPVIPTRSWTAAPGREFSQRREVESGRVRPDAFVRASAVQAAAATAEPTSAAEEVVTLTPVERSGPVLPPLRSVYVEPEVAREPADDSLPSDSVMVVAGATDSPSALSSEEIALTPDRAAAAWPRKVRVAAGESLTKIAKRELGSDDGRMVKLILAANPILRGRADRILVGQELTIPDPTRGSLAAADPDRNLRARATTASPRRDVRSPAKTSTKSKGSRNAGATKAPRPKSAGSKMTALQAEERFRFRTGLSAVMA